MRAAGQASNLAHSSSDKRPVCHANAHEYAISRPDVDQYAGTYPFPYEGAHHHACAYEFAYADYDAVGHSYPCPDAHTDSYEVAYAVSNTNQHQDTRAYGHTDNHRYTAADTGSNRHECPNGNIHTRNNRDIVTDSLPHPHAGTLKLTYPRTDTTTHHCPYQHAHTDARSQRDVHAESDRGWRRDCGNRLYLLRRCGVETGAGRVCGNRQRE